MNQVPRARRKDIHLDWSLKYKVPESSRRLPTFPILRQINFIKLPLESMSGRKAGANKRDHRRSARLKPIDEVKIL